MTDWIKAISIFIKDIFIYFFFKFSISLIKIPLIEIKMSLFIYNKDIHLCTNKDIFIKLIENLKKK